MNQTVVVISALLGIALVAVAALVPADNAASLEKAIKLASTVLGFAMAVFGAVKAILGITGPKDLATIDEVVPAGITAGAGALLVLASAIGA